MAGLAAAIGAGQKSASAIAEALAARGAETASWAGDGLHVAVRAAMPAVHEVEGRAVVLDGNASPSAMVAGYAHRGAVATLGGPDPYAVILADPARDALVLARHGDGPPLYWAVLFGADPQAPGRHGATVLAASEPAALLAAGVPAEPEPAVVARFLATGACDDGVATFFANVRRVLPGQAVEVVRDPGAATFTVRTHESATIQPPDAPAGHGRVGIRLSPSAASIGQLEATLHAPGAPKPLPVYSATFPELATLDNAGSLAAPMLAPLARSAAVRHRALPFFTDEIDVDAYLADLGEPTPYLDDWLLWAVARRVAGEVDVLADAAGGAHRSRLTDRVASRFGVVIRPPHPDAAAGPAPPEALLPDLLRRMRAELATTFLDPRLAGRGRGLAMLMTLLAGGPVDAGALWRRYVLERWLRCVVAPVATATPARRSVPVPLTVDDSTWTRQPVRTEVFGPGDKIPEKVAWYVGEAVPAPGPAGAWYVVLAAKAVAAMQGRARSLWDIRPGLTARLLHRISDRSDVAGPWRAQAAIDEAGWWRTVASVAGTWLGRPPARTLAAIRGPRPDAVPPGHVTVTLPPVEPDQVASQVVGALRTALPDSSYATFSGCAVVAGGQLLGWAARPGELPPGHDAAPPAVLWADDPFGDDHTPIVIIISG